MSYREKQRFDQSPDDRNDDGDFESSPTNSHRLDESTISQLEQELDNGMKKLNIQDKDALREEVQWTEERIKNYQDDEEILQKLKDLQLLDDKIKKLKSTPPSDKDNSDTNTNFLEQQLINEMTKLHIDDKNKLPQEIEQTEERIKNYPENEEILKQLKDLVLLDDKIMKLKSVRLVETPAHLERSVKNNIDEVESNDQSAASEHNKRSYSNDVSDQSAKRFREESHAQQLTPFYIDLHEVRQVVVKSLLNNIKMKYRRLCKWHLTQFPGTHFVSMDRRNYKNIVRSPYMVTAHPVCKRYMMLIEERGSVYVLDQGNHLYTVDNIEFPCDLEYKAHLTDTLVDGIFVVDKVDGSNKVSFLISDIITYNGRNVSTKPLRERLKLISQSIVDIRNKTIRNGHIEKTKQPFSIESKRFYPLSHLNKLLDSNASEALHVEVDAFYFLPENDPYTPGECQKLLKWRENEQVEFRLEIINKTSNKDEKPKKEAHLFLNKQNDKYATMPYSPNLDQYDKKIISCSYKNGEWHFHRLREDRPYPNHIKSAINAVKAIEASVSRKKLCDLIKNQKK